MKFLYILLALAGFGVAIFGYIQSLAGKTMSFETPGLMKICIAIMIIFVIRAFTIKKEKFKKEKFKDD